MTFIFFKLIILSDFNVGRANFNGVLGKLTSISFALPKRTLASSSNSISLRDASYAILRSEIIPIAVKVSGISLGRFTIKTIGVAYLV